MARLSARGQVSPLDRHRELDDVLADRSYEVVSPASITVADATDVLAQCE